MFDLVCENGVARIWVFVMDVVALIQEPFDDVIHRVLEVLITFLYGDAGLFFQSGDDLSGHFGPVVVRDTEILSEVEQGTVGGLSFDACGLKECE